MNIARLVFRLTGAVLLLPLALGAQAPARKAATPAEALTVSRGFKVELLRSAEPEEGSWVCLTTDDKGRLIVAPQNLGDPEKGSLLRVTPGTDGKIAKFERIPLPLYEAQGMLHAFGSLYVVVNKYKGKFESGLYRLRDTKGNDQYDEVTLLRKIDGGGEHGPHAIVLGPDKKLYVVCGNFVKVPEDVLPGSPHRNYADDHVLPRMEDGRGFGAGRKPPGGFVMRLDPDGQHCELLASGQRNTYDIAFSPAGELFGFDSDMEWDWGTPWYRPTRIYHIVSGGDQGFREGTGKWPEYYPDSLPATVNIGIGSPTGVAFGTGAKFPAKYQKALFAMDWSYGRIIAVHLTPFGGSYTGTFEHFVAPSALQTPGPKTPLNVTDLVVGRDGAMYFTTGGRGTQSGLYRVSYVGGESTAPANYAAPTKTEKDAAAARALRHSLEAFHGRRDAKAVAFAWPHLNSEDRWIRYAARLAIESQPVGEWQARALKEGRPRASLTALLALSRLGHREVQPQVLGALRKLGYARLDEAQKLELLRDYGVCIARMGKPSAADAAAIVKLLDPEYPTTSERLNRELSQLLVSLDAPYVVTKTLVMLRAASTQEEQLHYVITLRNVKAGWTKAERETYFAWFLQNRSGRDGGPTYPGGASYTLAPAEIHPASLVKWFADVGREYGDGASFNSFLANIRTEAIATLADGERTELASLSSSPIGAVKTISSPRARPLVKEWTMDDLLPELDKVSKGRSFERGREMFSVAQCLACHRFGNEGGAVGPDITAVSSRFSRRDLLESIVLPSKVVSEQYQNMTVLKKDGDDVTGRVIEDTPEKIVISVNPLTDLRVTVARKDVKSIQPSKLSPMPEGLINTLKREDILDLLAYIESSGRKDAAAFRK